MQDEQEFSTPRVLEGRIKRYFRSMEEEGRVPTLAGLQWALGLTDRRWGMYCAGEVGVNDTQKEDFCRVIHRAIKRIEAETLERTLTGEIASSVGQMVLASDFGYRKERELPSVMQIRLPPELEEEGH